MLWCERQVVVRQQPLSDQLQRDALERGVRAIPFDERTSKEAVAHLLGTRQPREIRFWFRNL